MKYIIYVFGVLFLSCCDSGPKTDFPENSSRILYDSSAKYMAVISDEYNDNGLISLTNAKFPYCSGLYLDSMTSITEYYYLESLNLEYKLRIRLNRGDSILTSYSYDDDQNLIREVVINLPADTTKIIEYYRSGGANLVNVEEFKLEKPLFSEDRINSSFDTSITFITKKFIDSLLTERLFYKVDSGQKKLEIRTKYYYDSENRLQNKLGTDSSGDSTSWQRYYYENGKLKINDLFLTRDLLISERYDEYGFLKHIIRTDLLVQETDTSFIKCDQFGNVIESRFVSK